MSSGVAALVYWRPPGRAWGWARLTGALAAGPPPGSGAGPRAWPSPARPSRAPRAAATGACDRSEPLGRHKVATVISGPSLSGSPRPPPPPFWTTSYRAHILISSPSLSTPYLNPSRRPSLPSTNQVGRSRAPARLSNGPTVAGRQAGEVGAAAERDQINPGVQVALD